jgi:hypothetical protein
MLTENYNTSEFTKGSMVPPNLSVKARRRSHNSGRSENLAAANIRVEIASLASSGHSLQKKEIMFQHYIRYFFYFF